MQRIAKLSAIEIRNVPISAQPETKSDLCNIVYETCKVINVNVQQNAIRDVFRLNGKSGKGTVVAEFASVIVKNDVVRGVKTYNKQHPAQRLNSAALGFRGQANLIYVSEGLTNKGRRLFYLARDLAKTGDYKFCWTTSGKIYLRKNTDSPHIEVKDETQLLSLRNQK